MSFDCQSLVTILNNIDLLFVLFIHITCNTSEAIYKLYKAIEVRLNKLCKEKGDCSQ